MYLIELPSQVSNTLNCVLIFEGLVIKVRIPWPRKGAWDCIEIRTTGGEVGDWCE